ncbi:MAG: hypothetical protein LAO06_15430 [Acidobacteriia bacterium]|nr:hypothetical protein [Terriglobia bacterium]
MKLAIPVACSRVSNAFDFARHLLLVDYTDGREVSRTELALEEELPLNRTRRLLALGVNVLVCGAISRFMAEHVVSLGIEVIPFVSGSVSEVLDAYLKGDLESARFLMAGSTLKDREEWTLRHHIGAAVPSMH